jgi:hypothetical protein
MASRAASGDLAGLERVETAGVVLAMHDDVVWIKAVVAAAAEVLFKGLGRKGPLRWWLSDVYTRFCSCRQCWASKCRGL